MFNFKKNNSPETKTIRLKISGMHCVSCAMGIDDALEDSPGVISAKTNYAKAETVVEYDQKTGNEEVIIKTINNTGYTAQRG